MTDQDLTVTFKAQADALGRALERMGLSAQEAAAALAQLPAAAFNRLEFATLDSESLQNRPKDALGASQAQDLDLGTARTREPPSEPLGRRAIALGGIPAGLGICCNGCGCAR